MADSTNNFKDPPNAPKVVSDVHPLSKTSRLLRVCVFLTLELGYIALAVVCYNKPLLLPFSFSSPRIRGILTVIFIAWQTFAILPVQTIAIFLFSGEWSVKLSRAKHLVPGETDNVSTLTSSSLDRAHHFFTGGASSSFRIAFVASMAFIALTSIAPGTFIPSSISINEPINLRIANLTITTLPPSLDGVRVFPIQRAELITRLEHVENSVFGYGVQPNWIVGWPPVNLPEVNGRIEYPSDGVRFQYECTWEAPEVVSGEGLDARWSTRQGSWSLWPSNALLGSDHQYTPNAVIHPLSSYDRETSLSAYLFLGSNSTLSQTAGASELDLSDIPATYNASGYASPEANRTDPHFYAPPLASVLVCDPRMNISSVIVARETNRTLHIASSNDTPPVVGNIPKGAANIIFSQSLLSVTSTPEPYLDTSVIVNFICSSMFLTDPTLDPDTHPIGTHPLELSAINANVDAYVLSASKAYAGGYLPQGGIVPAGEFITLPVNGTMQVQRQALVTSEALMVVTIVVVGMTSILLAVLAVGMEGGQPFTLGSVINEVQRIQLEIRTMEECQPLIVNSEENMPV